MGEELKTANAADNEKYDELQQNMDALKSECNELRASKDEMEHKYEQQIEELVKKLEANENDLKVANDASSDTQKKMNEIKEENANLSKQLDEKDEELGVLEIELDDLKKSKDAMQITMDGLIEQKEELEQNVNALKSEYKVSKENADKMEAEYERQIEELIKKMEDNENNLKLQMMQAV